ncbi:hypothetical protein TEQG_06363, partial [Trichophyton equinum CBS 127.97]
KPGTVPTDLEQSTGLERLELLGKMQGIDIFDQKPLDASRLGTIQDPIIVKSAGEEHYVGCTGYPADSHTVIWLTVSKDRPIERCSECGNTIKMDYVGPKEDPHAHGKSFVPGPHDTMNHTNASSNNQATTITALTNQRPSPTTSSLSIGIGKLACVPLATLPFTRTSIS